MEMFREDSSEDDFSGFTSEEVFVYGNRRMNKVHTTAMDPAVQEADKENGPATKRPKKTDSWSIQVRNCIRLILWEKENLILWRILILDMPSINFRAKAVNEVIKNSLFQQCLKD